MVRNVYEKLAVKPAVLLDPAQFPAKFGAWNSHPVPLTEQQIESGHDMGVHAFSFVGNSRTEASKPMDSVSFEEGGFTATEIIFFLEADKTRGFQASAFLVFTLILPHALSLFPDQGSCAECPTTTSDGPATRFAHSRAKQTSEQVFGGSLCGGPTTGGQISQAPPTSGHIHGE